MEEMTDPAGMLVILAYCRAHRIPCHVIRTQPTSTIGGTSAELIGIDSETATIERANGDRIDVPTSELSMTVDFTGVGL
jgi:hypothetical protein